MFVFWKIWYGLFSCNKHFETNPFTLLLTMRVLFQKREFDDSVKTTCGKCRNFWSDKFWILSNIFPWIMAKNHYQSVIINKMSLLEPAILESFIKYFSIHLLSSNEEWRVVARVFILLSVLMTMFILV